MDERTRFVPLVTTVSSEKMSKCASFSPLIGSISLYLSSSPFFLLFEWNALKLFPKLDVPSKELQEERENVYKRKEPGIQMIQFTNKHSLHSVLVFKVNVPNVMMMTGSRRGERNDDRAVVDLLLSTFLLFSFYFSRFFLQLLTNLVLNYQTKIHTWVHNRCFPLCRIQRIWSQASVTQRRRYSGPFQIGTQRRRWPG